MEPPGYCVAEVSLRLVSGGSAINLVALDILEVAVESGLSTDVPKRADYSIEHFCPLHFVRSCAGPYLLYIKFTSEPPSRNRQKT